MLCILCSGCFTDPAPAASSDDDDDAGSTTAPQGTTSAAEGGSSESGAGSSGSSGPGDTSSGSSETGDPLDACESSLANAPTVGAAFVIVVDPGTPVDWGSFSAMVDELATGGNPVAILLPSNVNVELEVDCLDGCFGLDCDERSVSLVHRYDGNSGLGALDEAFDEVSCVLDDGALLPRKRNLWLYTVVPEQTVPVGLATQLGAETSVHVSCEDCDEATVLDGPLGIIVARTFGAVTGLDDFLELGAFLGQPRYTCAWPAGAIDGREYFVGLENEDLGANGVLALATEVAGPNGCDVVPEGPWDTDDVPLQFFRVSPQGRVELTQLCGPACSLAQTFPSEDTSLFDVNCEP